jgi:PAS domain S-box-containing protein
VRGGAAKYALALGVLAAAVFLRWLLDPWLSDALPFVTLFGAVAYAVWIGGYQPAAVVVILGYLAVDYLFIPPRGRFAIGEFADVVGLTAYLFTCALIIAFGEATRRATHRANERRELLQVTLRSIGDAVITTNIDGRVTYLNAVAEALTGWTHLDAVGQPLDAVFRIVNQDTRLPVPNPATRALREGTVVGLANHTILLKKDGGECAIDDSAAPIRDESGRVSGCVLIFRDVTAQRRVEQEKAGQLLTARLLASIIESSNDAIISKSLSGTIQSWNAAAERLFGHTADQAVGQHISLVIPPDRLQEEEQIIARLKAGDRIQYFETERIRRDGQRIIVSLTISPIRDDSGTVVGASKIVRDVTARRAAEQRERLVEAEREKFVTLVENSTDFIGMCDLAGVPFFVNRAGLELVGLDDLEQAQRTPVSDFFFPDDQPRIMHEFFPSVLERGRGEIEVRFRHFKTGEPRWMAYKVLTLPDADGRPIGFATVSQDVTERKQLADELRALAADLSEADRKKNEFLAMLAHELRNPLAPISNAARVLRERMSDGETVRSASEMLARQVAQLGRLVDDLLDISRISRGKIELRKRRAELAPIVQQAAEAVRPLCRSLNHELTTAVPSQTIYVDGDAARLTQVVGNLLSNACKFTNPGGHIQLTVSQENGDALIRVRDDGIGLAADHLGMVFDMFAQVDTSLERSRDGLGIGLTLVKTLVELHGGSVTVASEGPGRGSEFTVRLPIAEDVEPAAPPPAAAPARSARQHRVLIVDDNDDGAESLSLLLQFAGHETKKAHDGPEAIELAGRYRPDVMLLDIGLPGMSGYEVCRRIRQEPWGAAMTIVALTGWGMEEDRKRSIEAGFDTHMVKPVDHDELMKLLASIPGKDDVASPTP